MGILFGLIKQIRYWDAPSKLALAINVVLLVIAVVVASTQPDLRQPATIATVGLAISLQVIVMYGNRHMVTPYTQAQRHFMAGEFEQARDVLQEHINSVKSPNVDTIVLLGNAQRNLGDLDSSLKTLQIAVNNAPDYHFALYGLGRTYLAIGDYAQATDYIQQALSNGAPPVIEFDLAHALYRRGDMQQAMGVIENVTDYAKPPTFTDDYRSLMAQLIYYRVGELNQISRSVIDGGMTFWQAEAKRFAHSPYGQAVQQDVNILQTLI